MVRRRALLAGVALAATAAVVTPWVVEGSRTLRFTVAKDAGLSLSLK